MDSSSHVLQLESIIVAATDQISANLANQEIVLNLKSGTYYGLDRVGTRIWAFLKQPRRVVEILDMLLARYDVDRARAERDLIALLQKMAEAGLVEVKNETVA